MSTTTTRRAAGDSARSTTVTYREAMRAALRDALARDERVFLIPRHDGEYGRVGVIAEVVEHGRSRRGVPVATVVGLHRGIAGAAQAGDDGDVLHVEVQEIHDGRSSVPNQKFASTRDRARGELLVRSGH